MKLSGDSSKALREAMLDAFQTWDALELLCSDCHRPLAQITAEATLPVAIHRIIEDCAARDSLSSFIPCMQQANPGNRLLNTLAFDSLTEAPTDEQVVESGEGKPEFKQLLTQTLSQLDQPGLHQVAAAELTQMLGKASDAEVTTLYLAVLGNLKLDRPPQVLSALVPVMGDVMGRMLGTGERAGNLDLDLDRTRLPRVDLGGLDLHGADIAFADLRHANLDDADLRRVRGYGVDISSAGFRAANLEEARLHFAVIAVRARFHNARMISTFFKDADLSEAEFQQAQLQGAHFERAHLNGAKFERANVSDAYFTGAKFDEGSIASIATAVGWDRAHFDDPVRKAIAAVH